MINDVLVIEGDPQNWTEALTITYEALHKKGYVKDSFLNGCIEREKKYPTGLPTAVPVAVPHTDSKHVITPAICFMRLKNPVNFKNMEDSEKIVPVEFIFNMALGDNNDQITMLRSIINTAQDAEFLTNAKTADLKVIQKQLKEKWIST